MKPFGKKIMSGAMAALLGLCIACGTEAASRDEIRQIAVNQKGSNFQYWNKDAQAYKELRAYVKDVTCKKSKNYIPKEDRLAVFDMDGTVLCEIPYYFDGMLFLNRALDDRDYRPSPEDRSFARDLRHWLRHQEAGDKLASSAPHQASVFAGMTYPEYTEYVSRFMRNTPVGGFSHLKWGEAFYLPMVEIIRYLQANDFQIYVVSGTERQLTRILVCDVLHIPENHIIGTDIEILAAGQGEKEPLHYAYQKDDHLVRGAFVKKNLQMNKVSGIFREIGKQPVLAFGNSGGDTSMLNFTINKNKYRSAAFFVLCDDLARAQGKAKKAEKCREMADKNGWIPISMRDDFRTVYGDDVRQTCPPENP